MRTSELSRAAWQLLDERAVDLDLVDGEVLQVRQRGVAGAEVVDRHADAEAAQALHLDRDGGQVGQQHRLGHLEDEPIRATPAAVERRRRRVR